MGTGEAQTVFRSTDSTMPTPSPAAEHERGGVGEADIDRIVEEVIRIISSRLAIERERRGFGRWR
jgi:hypothetical protein